MTGRPTTSALPDSLAGDILEGLVQIAAFLGKTDRQTYWLIESKQIPAFKIGGRWHMRRSTFLQRVRQLEDAIAD